MIVADASAILAIILDEPEADVFGATLSTADGVLMTPVNLWEVLVRARAALGEPGRVIAEDLLATLRVEIAAMTAAHARAAATAFERFGRRTPAGLNLGDCFAYALAKSEGCALLFKGDDFPRTDVARAL